MLVRVSSDLVGLINGGANKELMIVTPGLRDIMHHIQFCTVLVMIAVNWPNFACKLEFLFLPTSADSIDPIVAQLAWADLVWSKSSTPTSDQSLYQTPPLSLDPPHPSIPTRPIPISHLLSTRR